MFTEESGPLLRYPVVLFDVGETLIGPRDSFGRVYAEALAAVGLDLPREALERDIRQTIGEMNRRIPLGTDRYRHFAGGEREYWLRFACRVIELTSGAPPDPALARRALDQLGAAFRLASAWKVYEDTRPALERLKRAGVRLGVVSNWDSNLPRVLELLGLTNYFEFVGVSALEGLEKPDPEFFLRVLQRMDASPSMALHVGDSPLHDCDGAASAGVDAVLIDRRGEAEAGPVTVRSLAELPRIARDGIAAT